MNQENTDDEILMEVRGALAHVTLNRPKVLNALSLNMIRKLSGALEVWAADEAVKCVFIKGAGERAFCAGGDVKAVYLAGKDGRRDEQIQYFAEEYALNRQLFHYPKPIIAFMNGITMGGGYGIAGNCRYRVATEKTLFAMPETGIGFFTDVGSVYHLCRCPGQIGRYLALTGSSIGPEDMMYAKLTDVIVEEEKEAELVERLEDGEDVESVLASLACAPGRSELEVNREGIDRCFEGGEVEEVLDRLGGSGGSEETKRIIESRSPTSLRVCDLHVSRARDKSFDAIMDTDLILAGRFMAGHDFYEGIRAMLVDKDKSPRWEPAKLADFGPEAAEAWFRS